MHWDSAVYLIQRGAKLDVTNPDGLSVDYFLEAIRGQRVRRTSRRVGQGLRGDPGSPRDRTNGLLNADRPHH